MYWYIKLNKNNKKFGLGEKIISFYEDLKNVANENCPSFTVMKIVQIDVRNRTGWY